MKYAKIIDGVFTLAPRKIQIIIDDVPYTQYNPTAENLLAQGWKPVTETSHGDAPAGYEYRPVYTDSGESIVQSWELVERELSADEALSIITGGAL